jgi:cytochrome c
MKTIKLIALALAASAILASGAAIASEALAKKNGCATCHGLDKKTVGPTWKDVAAKYKNDAKAIDMLAAKVKAGGKGVWGSIPMPPQTKVADADMKDILRWALAQ